MVILREFVTEPEKRLVPLNSLEESRLYGLLEKIIRSPNLLYFKLVYSETGNILDALGLPIHSEGFPGVFYAATNKNLIIRYHPSLFQEEMRVGYDNGDSRTGLSLQRRLGITREGPEMKPHSFEKYNDNRLVTRVIYG